MNDKLPLTPPATLPPIPEGYKYGGQLKDYDNCVTGCVFEGGVSDNWGPSASGWYGMRYNPHEATADWHIAVPEDAEVPALTPVPELGTLARLMDHFEVTESVVEGLVNQVEDLKSKLTLCRTTLEYVLGNHHEGSGEFETRIEETLKQTAPKS